MQNGKWEAEAVPTEYMGEPSFKCIKLKADQKNTFKKLKMKNLFKAFSTVTTCKEKSFNGPVSPLLWPWKQNRFKTESLMNSCIIFQQEELWMLFFHFLRKFK